MQWSAIIELCLYTHTYDIFIHTHIYIMLRAHTHSLAVKYRVPHETRFDNFIWMPPYRTDYSSLHSLNALSIIRLSHQYTDTLYIDACIFRNTPRNLFWRRHFCVVGIVNNEQTIRQLNRNAETFWKYFFRVSKVKTT